MKKQICILIVLCLLGFISCTSNKSAIKGNWKMVEKNGQIPNRDQLKHYTEKNFISYTVEPPGIIIAACAGEYRIDKDQLYENIDMIYGDKDFIGRTAKIKVKIKKDTLYQNIMILFPSHQYEMVETWVRIK